MSNIDIEYYIKVLIGVSLLPFSLLAWACCLNVIVETLIDLRDKLK